MTKSIWFYESCNLDQLSELGNGTLSSLLEISFLEIGDNYLVAAMPVTTKSQQPFGILHGGASCVLAETVGSVASNLCLDSKKFYAVGLSIIAHHIKPVKDGNVYAKCLNTHLGKSTHLWDISIYKDERLSTIVAKSTLTTMVLPHKASEV